MIKKTKNIYIEWHLIIIEDFYIGVMSDQMRTSQIPIEDLVVTMR